MLEIFGKVDEEILKNLNKEYNFILKKFALPKNVTVNLNFVTEKQIQKLNAQTRNIDSVTDVLTYPYINIKPNEKFNINDYKLEIDRTTKTLTIGDIYICLARAKQQAKEYGHSQMREICFLFCHGMLHILGYDHIKKTDAKNMEQLQDEILNELGITRDAAEQAKKTYKTTQTKLKINEQNKKATKSTAAKQTKKEISDTKKQTKSTAQKTKSQPKTTQKPEQKFQCGFVTILGETNAGKSTLINRLVGQKVAIVSPKSQTTRENLRGIYNDKTCQIVFVDTPGYHKRKTAVDDEMDKQIASAVEDTEIVLLLIDAKKPLVPQYEKLIARVNTTAKKILLINKVDESTYEKLYPQLAELNRVAQTDEILPISALKGKNCDVLIDMIKKYLPTFDHEMRYYPLDDYVDKNLRQMVAEIVREKALLCLDDEIPHGIQVVVSAYDESTQPIQINADLYCEKENHKAIILGRGGEMIKKISTLARKDAEKLIGAQINLQIYVKVKENWRNNPKAIAELGLNFEE